MALPFLHESVTLPPWISNGLAPHAVPSTQSYQSTGTEESCEADSALRTFKLLLTKQGPIEEKYHDVNPHESANKVGNQSRYVPMNTR